MKTTLAATVSTALIMCFAQATMAAPAGTKVVVPGGTPITFRVTDKVSSGTAIVGDTFGVTVLKDVVGDGWVVVAKGAGGLGEVLKVDRAGVSWPSRKPWHPTRLGVRSRW